jgi:hypothetical protein
MQVFSSGIGDDIDDDDRVDGDVSLRSHSWRRVLPLAWYYISTFLTGSYTWSESHASQRLGMSLEASSQPRLRIKLHIHNCISILLHKSSFYIVMLFPKISLPCSHCDIKDRPRTGWTFDRGNCAGGDNTWSRNYAEDVANVLEASATIIRKPFDSRIRRSCPYQYDSIEY